jgi:hypothetical protein
MERSPAWKPPPPPEHSTTKRRQRSLSPRPQDYHPARIRKVAWPRDAPKPSEAELRATFSRIAPVANVGIGSSNQAIVVFTTCEGAQKAQDDYQGLWRVSTPKVSHEEAKKTLRVMKDAAPATPVHSPPHSRSPSQSRSPRRRRRSGSFDLSALVAKDKPAESRRDLAKRILVVSWDTTKPPPEDSELKCFFGFFDFVLATHVTPRRGLVLVASREHAEKCVAACRKHQYQRFRVRVLGRKGAGTSPAVRHIRAATRESLSVRWGWEAAETPSPGSKSFAVPRTPRSSRQSTPDRYGEGERPYVVGGMLLADDAMSVSSASSVDEGPSVNRRVAFGTPVKKEAVVMREAPVAAAAAKHHHHAHKKEAPHPPSLTREAAVANEAPAASVSVKKHHHARKDASTARTPRKAEDATTSPIPKRATEAATSPPPVPSYMRRTGPSPAERNYAAVAESLARDALQAKKEAAAMRARALRAEDLLALAVRRPPTAAWREAAPPLRPRAPAVRRRVNPRPPSARPEDLYVEYADEARAPAPRYAQMTLSQQRRRFGVEDYRAFRESVCSQPPHNWYDSKPVGAY